MSQKPFSQACENNKHAILTVLERVFAETTLCVEVGSGTGQHAVHFAPALPHITWQTSDLIEQHLGINRWLNEAALPNIRPPVELNLANPSWPPGFDAIFSANTAHIMPWECVCTLLASAGRLLPVGGILALYGPFNYEGQYTSDSNAQFDVWLKSVAPHRGIRDFEAINGKALAEGLRLIEDNEMPANNRLLIWVK